MVACRAAPVSKVMLITGAASGIGRRLAERYASPPGGGAKVVAADLDLTGLERVAADNRWDPEQVTCVALDVRDPAAWDTAVQMAVERWGRLDVLMNVAGVLMPGYVWELTPAQVDLHFDVNVKGVVYGTRAAASVMKPLGAGHIINLGSLSALVPVSGLTLYSASKFAVRGFSLAAAQDLAPHGVSLTVIHPDAVQTPMLDLQVDYEQAALTFSGSRALSVDEVRLAVDKALAGKPMEIVLPLGRGLLAKMTTVAPGMATRIAGRFRVKGRQAQEKIKMGRG